MKFDSRGLLDDRRAIAIAALCFIHCVAGPVLLSFAGLSSLIGITEKIEPMFVLSSVIVGLSALIPGYRHKHGRFSCLALFIAGLFCLVVLRRLHWILIPEAILAGTGAALIIGAHTLNLRLGLGNLPRSFANYT